MHRFAVLEVVDGGARALVHAGHARRLCDGHFPDEPLVPGAYLAELMAEVAAQVAGGHPVALVRCVFLTPVHPDLALEVRARRAGDDVHAEVRSGGRRAAVATLRFAA